MNKFNKTLSIIVIILVCLGIVNGEYLRPTFGTKPILKYILGSLPNFIGSFILFVLITCFFLRKKYNYINLILFLTGFLVFLFLTIEEYFPFFTGSKTFDIIDIIANGFGVLFAFILIRILSHKLLNKKIFTQ